VEKDIDHYWAEGQTPAPGIGTIHYSARYTTYLSAQKNETINFEIEGDDGYRIFINDSLYIDSWLRNRWGTKLFRLPVKKDERYKIVVEFYQNEGNASIRLKSGKYVKTDFPALAARLKDADAIIFAGGISPQLEGEEMRVNFPGFNGGDRTTILLPAVQTELMKALKATGKPLVFVMMTGSAIATPWESENVSAILNAWYGGQSAGTAVADVLFGDYNPAGRLPVTFYKADSDLPSFMSYDMSGRTYRYFEGEALYPFGYGLSYTTFRYTNMTVPAQVKKGASTKLAVTVKNTGIRNGEEVLQLYVSHQNANGKAPLKALKGFQRIALKAGESRTISFNLTAEQLSLVDENGKLFQPSGKVLISVGGGQPGVKNKTTSNVISKEIKIW
jgi:beta-glucosidase